jgi:hemoglobin/transferrin/lactoferrin receptor protein
VSGAHRFLSTALVSTPFVTVENLTNMAYSPAVSGDSTAMAGRGRTVVVGLTTQL